MNPLDQYPAIRRYLYLVQWVVNLVMGVIAVVLLAKGQTPESFIIVTAAFNFIWTYTGLTAQGNVTETNRPELFEHEISDEHSELNYYAAEDDPNGETP